MKKYAVNVGIDVSKSKLDVRFVFDPTSKEHAHLIVTNDEPGVRKIIGFLKKKQVDFSSVLFCFENTGLYSVL